MPGNIIFSENLSSDPSSPEEGLLKRVNGVLKIADSSGDMIGIGNSHCRFRIDTTFSNFDAEFASGTLATNGTITLSENATGDWQGTLSSPPSETLNSSVVVLDESAAVFVLVEVEANSDGTFQLLFSSSDGTSHDPAQITGYVTIPNNSYS